MQVDIEEYTKQMFDINKKLKEKKEVNTDENIVSTEKTSIENSHEDT